MLRSSPKMSGDNRMTPEDWSAVIALVIALFLVVVLLLVL